MEEHQDILADACTACAPGTMALTPGASSCVPHTATCLAGKFAASTGSATADRDCQDCPSGSVRPAPPSGHTGGIASCLQCTLGSSYVADPALLCAAVRTCSPGEGVVSPPTTVADRECAPCAPGTYSSAAALLANPDAPCSPCPPQTYQPGPGASACIAQSAPCDGVTEYAIGAATPTSDRACGAVKTCGPDEYEFAAPTPTSDRHCRPRGYCRSGQYSTAQPTAFSRIECAACPAGTQQLRLSHRLGSCDPCPAGTFKAIAGKQACSALADCPPGTHVPTTPTATTDRVCVPCAPGSFSVAVNVEYCDACPTGSFQTAPGATGCLAVSQCSAGHYVATAATPAADLICASCEPGTFVDAPVHSLAACTTCPSETYQPSPGSTGCIKATTCAVTTEYELHALTPIADRVCAAQRLTPCGVDEYAAVEASSTTLLQCEP